jgi:hypothetical protein
MDLSYTIDSVKYPLLSGRQSYFKFGYGTTPSFGVFYLLQSSVTEILAAEVSTGGLLTLDDGLGSPVMLYGIFLVKSTSLGTTPSGTEEICECLFADQRIL